jgi:hypothetical protein
MGAFREHVLDHREHVVKISSPLTTTSGEFQTIKVYDILLKTMMTIKHHNIASLRGHDSLWESIMLFDSYLYSSVQWNKISFLTILRTARFHRLSVTSTGVLCRCHET